jgi:hypothetical protein
MSETGKVLDFVSRWKKNQPPRKKAEITDASVTDMSYRRQEIISSEKRQVKRTILSEFVGTYVVVPKLGLQSVLIHDISQDGLAFDLDTGAGSFRKGEEVAMRIYLNKDTYFPFVIKVSNIREDEFEGVYRHGASFVKGTINDEALHHFVKFIETVSASLERDNGDVMVANLGGFHPTSS